MVRRKYPPDDVSAPEPLRMIRPGEDPADRLRLQHYAQRAATLRLADSPEGFPRVRVAWWTAEGRRVRTLPRAGDSNPAALASADPERAALLLAFPHATDATQQRTPRGGRERRWLLEWDAYPRTLGDGRRDPST